MNLIKPKKLKKGSTIGFIALSGAIEKEENIYRAKEYFENKGYKILFSKNIFDKNRYLAGSDENKVKELHRFFKDKNIDAILCARGGYGAIRFLDKIDFDLIKNNPKIFAGYSDTSALQAMIFKKTGLITFYSPMAQSDFGVKEISKITEKSFFQTLENTAELELSPERKNAKVYCEGEAKGFLWGGNLSTIVSLCGLDFVPNEKFILFIEDLNEPVYKIDKMIIQLLNIEKFKKNVQGIILGDFLKNGSKKYFDELFFEIGGKYSIPILSGFKITHAHEKITLPYGAQGYFSTKSKKLIISNFLK